MYYDRRIVSDGAAGLEGLKGDVTFGQAKSEPSLRVVQNGDGGKLYGNIIGNHEEFSGKLADLLIATERLLGNAEANVRSTIRLYDDNEQSNLDELRELWGALEMEQGMQPIGPAPAGTVTANEDWWRRSLWELYPGSRFDHRIFDVLNWPDYLSISWWARQLISLIAKPLLGGQDPWTFIWDWIGGDWEAVEEAAFHWGQMGSYYADMSEELELRMQHMFSGWYDSEAATASGEYFRVVAEALASVQEPMADLDAKYLAVAVSSYGFCQALWSLVDALVDAAIAAKLLGITFVEALAAPFTGGATAATGMVTLIMGIIETVSAAWGAMMVVVNGFLGIGGLLGANLRQIEWVTLPEG